MELSVELQWERGHPNWEIKPRVEVQKCEDTMHVCINTFSGISKHSFAVPPSPKSFPA